MVSPWTEQEELVLIHYIQQKRETGIYPDHTKFNSINFWQRAKIEDDPLPGRSHNAMWFRWKEILHREEGVDDGADSATESESEYDSEQASVGYESSSDSDGSTDSESERFTDQFTILNENLENITEQKMIQNALLAVIAIVLGMIFIALRRQEQY